MPKITTLILLIQKKSLACVYPALLLPGNLGHPMPDPAREGLHTDESNALNSAAARNSPAASKQCTLKMARRKQKQGDGRPIITLKIKSKEKGIDKKFVKSGVSIPHAICNCLRLSLSLIMVSPSTVASLGRHTNLPPNCCPNGQRYATELGSVGETVVLAFCSSAVESVVFFSMMMFFSLFFSPWDVHIVLQLRDGEGG